MKLCSTCAIFTPDTEPACPKCTGPLAIVPSIPTITVAREPSGPSVPRYLLKLATVAVAALIGVFLLFAVFADTEPRSAMNTETAKGACRQFVEKKLAQHGSATFARDPEITHGSGRIWRIEGGVDASTPRSAVPDRLTYSCLLEYLGDEKWTALSVSTRARIP